MGLEVSFSSDFFFRSTLKCNDRTRFRLDRARIIISKVNQGEKVLGRLRIYHNHTYAVED